MLDIKMIERGLEKPGKTKGGLAPRWAFARERSRRSCPGYA